MNRAKRIIVSSLIKEFKEKGYSSEELEEYIDKTIINPILLQSDEKVTKFNKITKHHLCHSFNLLLP